MAVTEIDPDESLTLSMDVDADEGEGEESVLQEAQVQSPVEVGVCLFFLSLVWVWGGKLIR
jgi:hypothetical protein